MFIQTLYVDFAGGKFEYWFYSDGGTYKNSAWDYSSVKKFYRTQGFNRLVLTNEAKDRI